MGNNAACSYSEKSREKSCRPTQADINDKCRFCQFQFSVRYGNFGNLERPSWDFQFRGVPDSRKAFARLQCGRNLRRTHNFYTQIKSVLFKNHGVGVNFWFERLRREINFDRARSTTVKWLLGALRFIFAIKRRLGRLLWAACILGMES